MSGFAVDGVADAALLLGSIASIQSIEPNFVATALELVEQQDPPYGLARISHREPGANTYIYDDSAGEGTFSYIIDTGIFIEHNDFEGRASHGFNAIEGEGNEDGNGHGTHVAGTTGGRQFGVAKRTQLIAVKVLGADGSGTLAGIIAGLDWAVNDMTSKDRIGRSVANLSLGSIFSPMVNRAAAAAVSAGMFLSIAAGNSGLPTITASPASERSACTVGATDENDNRATFSNFGLLVDIFAPGVEVTSAWIDGPDSTLTISGTSMAAPHAAGLGAYLLGLEGERSPDALCSRIRELATRGAITDPLIVPGLITTNRIAYNGNGA